MNLSETFNDIEPIPQDDGPNPVCVIDYPESFVEVMGFLRAIMKKEERSERALELTAIALRFNPANYTTWWYRRQCLASLSNPPPISHCPTDSKFTYYSPELIEKDLKLAQVLGGPNPKNYQIWYHRRNLLERILRENPSLNIVEEQLEYIATVLKEDAKNYHAWSHRQWILNTVNDKTIWEDELVFTEFLVLEDVRNNSAWNQRWFVVHRGSHSSSMVVDQEIEYALSEARKDPYNECPWRYFVAIVKEQNAQCLAEEFQTLIQTCESKVLDVQIHIKAVISGDINECIYMYSAWIDILEMKGTKEAYQVASKFAHQLEVYDSIRQKYWKLRYSKFQAKLEMMESKLTR